MKRVETKTTEIILHDKGYAAIRYKPGAMVDLSSAKEDFEKSMQLSEGQPFPIFVDARGLKHATREARIYNAREELKGLIIASAVLVDSIPTRIMANMYMTFQKPGFPIKVFSNEYDAMQWLNAYIKK